MFIWLCFAYITFIKRGNRYRKRNNNMQTLKLNPEIQNSQGASWWRGLFKMSLMLIAATLVACGGGGSGTIDAPAAPIVIAPPPVSSTQPHTVELLAGAIGGDGYRDGAAATSRLSSNSYVEYTEPDGAIIVGDNGNQAVRRISADRTTVSTVFRERGFASIVRTPNGFVGSSGTRLFSVDLTAASPASVLLAGSNNGASIDGVGAAARFSFFNLLARATDGTIYVADVINRTVRKVLLDGTVSTLAGSSGLEGFNDGTGSAARFGNIQGIAVDAASNVYVADRTRIRRITPAGVVSTFAGSEAGTNYIDGVGAAAIFVNLSGLSLSPDGSALIAVDNSSVIRRIELATAQVTTLFVPSAAPTKEDGPVATARVSSIGRAIQDASGNLIFHDFSAAKVRNIAVSAGLATTVSTLAGVASNLGNVDGSAAVARFNEITGFSLVRGSNFAFVRDGARLARVNAEGAVSTLATGVSFPSAMANDAAGNVYVATYNNTVEKITPAGALSTLAGVAGEAGNADGAVGVARLGQMSAMAIAADGSVLVADASGRIVRRISSDGSVTTLAGNLVTSGNSAGNGVAASFGRIESMAYLPNGDLMILTAGEFYKMTPAGVVTALYTRASAGAGYVFVSSSALSTDAAGNTYAASVASNSQPGTVFKLSNAGALTRVIEFGLAGERFAVLGGGGSTNETLGFSLMAETSTTLEFWAASRQENAIFKILIPKVP
jgi:sugar lactone lactonase YvrE